MDDLGGQRCTLTPVQPAHADELRRILHTPSVWERWGDDDRSCDWPFDDPTSVRYGILVEGVLRGLVQYWEEEDPSYRHACIDIFLDPDVHGQGIGRDAVGVLAHHLIVEQGHHRLTIDPAADNDAAIRSYAAVGFRPVGVMRQYERDADGGGWHDGLLMELLASDLKWPEMLPGSRPT